MGGSPFFVCGEDSLREFSEVEKRRHYGIRESIIDAALQGLGYELVDMELSNHSRLLRLFIDKPNGVTVDDCARVSNHVGRLLAVENFNYDRLEVSSPGLDRPLKKSADFVRFKGKQAHIKLRVPIEGRRHFTGILGSVEDDKLSLAVEGESLFISLANVDKARLVPEVNFNAR